MKSIIVAYDRNRLIGGNNSLLWQGQMKADMRRFRELTTGNVVIMGRKTFDSIGQPLPNRQNIVISRQALKIAGVSVACSLDDAYAQSEPDKNIYVIGGGQIFEQSLSSVDEILATEIDATFDGDTYFPALTPQWHQTVTEHHQADDANKYDYTFVTYTKQQ